MKKYFKKEGNKDGTGDIYGFFDENKAVLYCFWSSEYTTFERATFHLDNGQFLRIMEGSDSIGREEFKKKIESTVKAYFVQDVHFH